MKRLLSTIAILSMLIVFGCAGMQPIQNPVCPQEGSFICEKSAELGVQPEQVYGWIYDAAALAALTDIVKIQELCDFEQKIADWYVQYYPFSFDVLIGQITAEMLSYPPEKMRLIKNIMNRNLVAYSSPQIIMEPDDIIFRKGHVAFRKDMLCY